MQTNIGTDPKSKNYGKSLRCHKNKIIGKFMNVKITDMFKGVIGLLTINSV